MREKPDWQFERRAWESGYERVAGIDEAGRGSLAGPVAAAAVVLDPSRPIEGVDDSKRLSPRQRQTLYEEITASALSWSVAFVDAVEIDECNILRATERAMTSAVASLPTRPDFLLLDAVKLPACGLPFEAIIGGDRLSVSIAAASIVAKVTRDRHMEDEDRRYPSYGFARHKGYGTQLHFAAIRSLGPSPIHRMTFRGVAPDQSDLPLAAVRPTHARSAWRHADER